MTKEKAHADDERPMEEPGIEALAAELAEVKGRLMRSLADQENVRAQARRDKDEAMRFAASGFARDLLPSIDNLERAIASVPQENREESAVANLLTGVDATRRALIETFAKHGLTRLDPLGQPFDPHLHEASFETSDPRYAPGTVSYVIQPGYLYHDRLLRPALVGVVRLSQAGEGVRTADDRRDPPAVPGRDHSFTSRPVPDEP